MAGALVVEARNVNDSIAQIRTYWAAQGATNYVLSRVRNSGACVNQSCPGGNNPNPPPAAMANYLTELQSDFGTVAGAPNSILWLYPELGPSYSFYLTSSANPDNLAPNWSGGAAKAGEYCLRFTFAPVLVGGTAPAPAPKPTGPCSGLVATTAAAAAPAPNQGQPIEAMRSLVRIRPVEVRFCAVTAPNAACGCTASNTSVSTACQNLAGANGIIPYNYVTSVHRPAN